ncbi:hypothetical protein TSUD_153300 [Trifolium subterraneum]|uniref:NB-ARC domain-containing protein n=1 Tax=Trifolium subterraneum TaxID=3900 RepID=A0A2Z6N0M7_TRISU|nr:hypothetical protein TSUD_153300 [Trifolium subterraneum]
MCDPCASVLSCARETLLPLARDHLLPLARKHLFPIALHHLLPILKEAVNMIRGVPNDEIAQMKNELETIEDAIYQADKMADAEGADASEETREKIKQLIEASFRIQDVIDEYIIREEQQLPDPGCVDGASDYVKTKFLRLQIAHDIQIIKSQINQMKDTSTETDHGFQSKSSSEQGSSSSAINPNATLLQNLRKAPFYMSEADVVGFEEPRKVLIDWLVKGRDELTVVSVVAMGGQGKTTLAKKVFDSEEVVKRFEYRIWITVSQSYNIEELLRGMLKELCKQQNVNPPQNIHEMTRESLVDEVRNYLRQKRYVVVFDDVWNSPFWADIKFAMIDKQKGSRILITTRFKDVATSCRESSFVEIHELNGLDDEQSLKLFNKKAFFDLEEVCPPNLIDISSKIVKKCGGLPLAIVVTGSLLCKNRNTIEWYKFNENIKPKLKKDYSVINTILVLSYHDLSYNLKSCLLYFGIYPEDCKVNSKILIQQWIAEGFVKEEEGMTLEEVAEGYLTELIHRSLVQVDLISIDGRVKSGCVHDLVHAMIIKKCKDLNFCKNICEDKPTSLTGMVQRLSIATDSDNFMESVENSQVRSLHICTPNILPESFLRRIPTKYRWLKVLAVMNDGLLEVPNDFGSLIHLKYLRFGGFFEEMYLLPLPKSIGMLVNLETLDLTNAMINVNYVMPKEICLLRKMRHFLGYKMSLIQLKDGIGCMTSLQTLSEVFLDDGEDENDNRVVELIEELGKLKQLRKLVLLGVRSKYRSAISSSINEMQQMENLKIHASDVISSTVIDIHLNSPPPMLQFLRLQGELEKLPKWISKLQNLVKLRVHNSMLTYDITKLLKSLPNLLSLSIVSCDYKNEFRRLHFQVGSFMNLKELHLEDLTNLNDILIEDGALCSLSMLVLCRIPKLKTIPTGIQHLKKFDHLKIYDMNNGFYQKFFLDGGINHLIFKQVPVVEIYVGDDKFTGRTGR